MEHWKQEKFAVQFTLQLPAELKMHMQKRESMVNWIFRVQGAEEPGKNEPSPAISQTTAPKTGIADPYVFVPLGIAAVAALGTVKLSRKEKEREEEKTVKRWKKALSGLLMAALMVTGISFPENVFAVSAGMDGLPSVVDSGIGKR